VAKIKPFKALTYNSDKIKELTDVVCPPYDVISEEQRKFYSSRSENNLVHLLLPQPAGTKNKYQQAGLILKKWLKDDILREEEKPAVYFYSQQYSIRGEKKTRYGFIALLHLGMDNCSAFAHENTRQAPKNDRFNLIKQVKANLSPIFVVFPDKKRVINRLFQKNIDEAHPFLKVTDAEKTLHKLWRIDSPELTDALEKALDKEDVFIADGHHRFEVACDYRRMMRDKASSQFTGQEDYNYIMAYFTNTDSRGLSILPTHRLLKMDEDFDFEAFKLKLKEYFEVEEIRDKVKFFLYMEKCGRSEHVIGIAKDKKFWLLRLKNIKTLDKLMPDRPKEYRSLDAAILNAIVFEGMLGFDPEQKGVISYKQDTDELIAQVQSDGSYIAFFLNPVKIEQIINVAMAGNRMPPKSTYFYPKLLSGLLINKFKE